MLIVRQRTAPGLAGEPSACGDAAVAAANVSSSAIFAKALDGVDTAAWVKTALDGLDTVGWAKSLLDSAKFPDVSAAANKAMAANVSPLAKSQLCNAMLHVDVTEARGEIKADAARASVGPLDAVFLVMVLVLLTGALHRLHAEVIVAEALSEVVRSLWSLWVAIFQLKSESAAADLLFNVLVFEVGRRMTPPPDGGR